MLSREVQELGWNLRAPTMGQVKQLAEEMDEETTDAQIDETIQTKFPDQLSSKVAVKMREAIKADIRLSLIHI